MDKLYLITYDLAIETTKLLNQKQYELSNITWSDGEANIDSGFSELACKCCLEIWEYVKRKHNLYESVRLECNGPDINLIFYDKYNKKLESKIELKSSKEKNKRIPGSTIGNLDINQPLIYCLRPKNINEKYEIRCSQYHIAMGKSNLELFQDRTPRPYINFQKMEYPNEYKQVEKNDWIKHYSKCALNRFNQNKKSSWQDYLVKNIIIDFIKNTTIKEFIKMKQNNFN